MTGHSVLNGNGTYFYGEAQVKPATRVFVDFEFNGANGEIISAAMVTEDGEQWYEVLDYSGVLLLDWVKENVIPVLNKNPISEAVFIASLQDFLDQYGYVEFIFNAHADGRYLKELLKKATLPLYRLVRDGKLSAKASSIPHNALCDALAIVDQVCGSAATPEKRGYPTQREIFRILREMGYRFDARDVKVWCSTGQHLHGSPDKLYAAATDGNVTFYGYIHIEPHAFNSKSEQPLRGTLTIPFHTRSSLTD